MPNGIEHSPEWKLIEQLDRQSDEKARLHERIAQLEAEVAQLRAVACAARAISRLRAEGADEAFDLSDWNAALEENDVALARLEEPR